MKNPWLAVPLAEYEQHMGAEGVQQLDALAELFGEALACCRPASVAVLGVAGGNGLERLDRRVTGRVAGIDINPGYLDAVRRRYPAWLELELHCADLTGPLPQVEPAALVHAALIFEHTGMGRCLDNAVALMARGGALSVVLQMPAEAPAVESGFAAIRGLAGEFRLVSPKRLTAELERWGLRPARERIRPLAGGKAFWAGIFTA